MHALLIELDELELPREVIDAIWDELTRGGVRFGKFYIGAVRRLPETVYFLWHLRAEVPVTMTTPRESMSHPLLARIAIEEFLMKWNQIID